MTSSVRQQEIARIIAFRESMRQKERDHTDALTADLAAAQAEIERLREPLPERPRCRVCGRRDGLDAVVSDEVWAALGFDPGWYVCLWCMDQRAAEVGITASATLYFAGEAISGGNETEREAVVLDQMAELRAEIGRLRAAGDALADADEAFWGASHDTDCYDDEWWIRHDAAVDTAQAALAAYRAARQGSADEEAE